MRIEPKFSLVNQKMRIKFQNADILSVNGKNLLNTQIEATIHRFIFKDTADYVLEYFFKYSNVIFGILPFLGLSIFGARFNWVYFGSMFEGFIALMIPSKLDPITIEQTKTFLNSILTFDFVKIIKTK